MDRKLSMICLLSMSAMALMIANFVTPAARADTSVNSREYQAVTARMQSGGEGLYLLDNRTGIIKIYTYDSGARTLKLRAQRSIADAFK